MNKITKEMFVSCIKSHQKLKATRPVFLVYIIVILVIFLRTPKEPIIWGIFAVLSILLTLVVLIMGRKIKVEEVDLDNFYLVEDEVENFKKRISLGKNRSGHNYIYTFRDHGEYTIYKSRYSTIELSFRKEKDISAEELSTESCNEGDLFYLLICKGEKKDTIVKAFYRYHFEIEKEDFVLIDGKYYCKGDANES